MIFEWAVRKKLFRNINHALWFMMSMYILILIVAYYFYPNSKIIVLFPISIHFVAFLQSIYAHVKKISSESISQDCIWWNLCMFLVYLCILGIVSFT
jgi:hypothetical protein